jgi:hypothetical protein
MNKRLYNDIEQIIKNAAEAYEPAFDEQAWLKMEVLLDKENNKTKPPFLWLWWLLPIVTGILAGGYLLFSNKDVPGNATKKPVDNHQQGSIFNNKNNAPTVNDPNIDLANNLPSVSVETNKPVSPILKQPASFIKPAGIHKGQKIISSTVNYALQSFNEVVIPNKQHSYKTNKKSLITIQSSQPVSDNENAQGMIEKMYSPSKDSIVKEADPVKAITVNNNQQEKIVAQVTEKKVDSPDNKILKKINRHNQSSKFYLLATAGADANGVKLFSSKKTTLSAGLGIGYQLSKKLSVQTGFFASSKKYVAGPQDYKTKPGSYWSMVDITKIDADCRVYEIPLSLRYDFNNNKKIGFFSSAGISSYFMKKEAYHYYYYRAGVAHDAEATYKGNQHLFSVIRFSSGIEKKLSRQLLFNAAPGLAIPLAGVGEGQVKLYSLDFMVGIKFIPVSKK